VVIRRQLKRRYALTFFQKSPPCLIGVEELLHVVADPADNRVPAIARGSRLKWNERLG
jgi:hypothetical protein